MKVLLNTNVPKLGMIGDVVEVKPGYARNFLLPYGKAIEPTPLNLKRIEIEKQKHLEELARLRTELEAKATLADGKELTITARANAEGHLYGSIGPAQVAEALAKEGVLIEAKHVDLEKPIQQLDKHDVTLKFGEDVTASIHLWVVPSSDSDAPAPPQAADADETHDDEEE